MTWLSSLRRSVFSAPYKGLPYAVFAYVIICFSLHPSSPIFTHRLADPDDVMRLNEVVSWLKGQGWYDLSVPRLSPGGHTVIHWSRLVDVPIALCALPFISFVGVTNATSIASFIVPFLWFAVLLIVVEKLAEQFVGKDFANLSCVMTLFAPMLLFNFSPGRVDHHGIQIIVAGTGLLCLCQIIRNNKATGYAPLAALVFSCGFWIGTEALPWVILFVASLAIAAAWMGKQVAQHAALFGMYLALFTTLIIPLALPPTEYSSLALSWFSPAYAIFSILSGAIFIVGWGICRSKTNMAFRFLVYIGLGILATALFFILVPNVLNGPFSDYDTFDATTALDNIGEAQPLARGLAFNHHSSTAMWRMMLTFTKLLFLPFVACAVCAWHLQKSKSEMRILWLSLSIFLFIATALTLFWQIRVGIFMEFFSIIPLTVLLRGWWQYLKWSLWDRPLFWAEIGVFLVLGFLPAVLLPSLATKLSLYPDIALFPATRSEQTCPLDGVIATLNDGQGLGKKPLTIMNSGDIGPELLFKTNDNAVAGNFDVPGNNDAYNFFHASDDTQAQIAARKWNANLVLICKTVPRLYLGKDYYLLPHLTLHLNADGMLHVQNTDRKQPLIQRLIDGKVPSWLTPIPLADQSDYLLFAINSAS